MSDALTSSESRLLHAYSDWRISSNITIDGLLSPFRGGFILPTLPVRHAYTSLRSLFLAKNQDELMHLVGHVRIRVTKRV